MNMIWNKCDICGKLIPLKDFETNKAVRNLIYPDSHRSAEEWETYHMECTKELKKKEEE